MRWAYDPRSRRRGVALVLLRAMSKPLAIDLFCGLGGWTEALLDEGWQVIGFDNHQHIYGEEKYPGELVLQDVLT